MPSTKAILASSQKAVPTAEPMRAYRGRTLAEGTRRMSRRKVTNISRVGVIKRMTDQTGCCRGEKSGAMKERRVKLAEMSRVPKIKTEV